MTPQDIYDSAQLSSSFDLYYIDFEYFVPEAMEVVYHLSNVVNTRVMIVSHAKVHIDYRRYHEITSIWFDGVPVMVCTHAGREGDDHSERFITDEKTYKKLVEYLKSLIHADDVTNLVPLDKDIPALTNFYGKCMTSKILSGD